MKKEGTFVDLKQVSWRDTRWTADVRAIEEILST